MNRIQSDDTQANDALDEIENSLNDVQDQFDDLVDRKNNVTKASPAAAYKRVSEINNVLYSLYLDKFCALKRQT